MNYLVMLGAVIGCVLCQKSYRPQSASGPVSNIISASSDINYDGSYRWSFQADNGIAAEESGQVRNANSNDPVEEAQGYFQYTAPDGSPIQVSYIANEDGFQPQGAHLPVPPPIPIEIQRSLEWNAAHPEEENAGKS